MLRSPIDVTSAAVSSRLSTPSLLLPPGFSISTFRSPNMIVGQRALFVASLACCTQSNVAPSISLGGIYTPMMYHRRWPETSVVFMTFGPKVRVLSSPHALEPDRPMLPRLSPRLPLSPLLYSLLLILYSGRLTV